MSSGATIIKMLFI